MSAITQSVDGIAATSQSPANALSVRFWGVRGSIPVSGPEYAAFGGRTCCVKVRCGERLFVVDAGTGIAPLGRFLTGGVCPPDDGPGSVIDLLLSHLHLDHVMGLPFFAPALGRLNTIRIHVGNLGGADGREALDRLFSPPLFPVRLDELPARFVYTGFRAGETLSFDDGLQVATCPLFHPDGASAYRFDFGGRRRCTRPTNTRAARDGAIPPARPDSSCARRRTPRQWRRSTCIRCTMTNACWPTMSGWMQPCRARSWRDGLAVSFPALNGGKRP